VESLETTGCGDVFHGAYAAALASGKEILDCLRFASAAAAVFATRPSGWQHLPTAADVNRLMTKIIKGDLNEHCRTCKPS
jgi:sulfofructose kinase